MSIYVSAKKQPAYLDCSEKALLGTVGRFGVNTVIRGAFFKLAELGHMRLLLSDIANSQLVRLQNGNALQLCHS